MLAWASGPVVVPAVLLLTLLTACSGDDGPSAAPSTTTTAAPTATPTATPSASPTAPASSAATAATPTTAPTKVGVRTLPPVRVGRTAAFTGGSAGRVVVRVTGVVPMRVEANGPGEIAGDGVQVRLAVRNASSSPFDLAGIAVTASYGGGRGTPAIPSSSQTDGLLAGSLAPGRSANGSYVFLVPSRQSDSVRVEVSSDAAADVLTFRR